MQEALNEIRSKLIQLIKETNNNDWVSAIVTIDFPPFTNRGYRGSQIVKNSAGNNIRLIHYNDDFNNAIYSLIFNFNQTAEFNQIVFSAQKDELENAKIEMIFSNEVNENFLSLISKSMKGKYVPWWKNPAETKDLELASESEAGPMQEPTESHALKMLKKHIARIPIHEPAISQEQLEGKTLQQLYALYDPYLRDKTTTLWDGGMIGIEKDGAGLFSGEIIQYYYEEEEYRETGSANYDEAVLPVVTDRMKSIYEAMQTETKRKYPGYLWNAIFISISPDGFAEANYELDGREIQLD